MTRTRARRLTALALMFASGFAGLGYEIVWTQQCALWLGHEAAAVLAIVTAFFGGLAVGAFALGSLIEKSLRPTRWYAGCELVIAEWSSILTLAMPHVSTWLLDITGAQPAPAWQWTVAFCGTFILLLPATAAMGATLPAIERVVSSMRATDRSIAPLYAANTLGAVAGVLTIAFWSVPRVGLVRTAYMCIALNLACGLVSLFSFPGSAMRATADVHRVRSRMRVSFRLLFTGCLAIGYEVLVVRVLSEVAEDTVYTFAMLLAVYLIGSAIGAALYQQWLARRDDHRNTSDGLLCALATACLIGTATLWQAVRVQTFALETLGASMSAAIGAEVLLALAAFGLPTIVMGALFSHLSACSTAAGSSFGRAVALNTAGAAVAPLLFGVIVLPMLGSKMALLLIGLGYLLLAEPRAWLRPSVWGPLCATLAIAVWAPPLAFIDVPEGGRVVSYREGRMAAVSVVEDADGIAVLRINNREQEGTSATRRVDGRQAWLPLLLHPSPQHVLFLGLGTGVTASSASIDPTLHVDAVELLPEVIDASRYFTNESTDRPHLNVVPADARRYVRANRQRYDVIVSDNFHPARSGSAALYTVEHFRAVQQRLTSHGVFCQWLPLHQLDIETLRSIVQSFVSVYPDAWAILASNSLQTPVVGLIGRADRQRFDADALRNHLKTSRLASMRAELGIEDEFSLLGSFIAGPNELKRFAGNAPANTDDYPIVAYRAPRITYAPDSLPRDRLIALLHEVSVDAVDVVPPDSDISAHRLAAYWSARNLFIESGRNVQASADVRSMLAQVGEPLLEILRISPDFRPAYDPLVRMAIALSHTDAAQARSLLGDLAEIQPAREEATIAMRELVESKK